MRCGRARTLISKAMDSALSTGETQKLAEHVSHCVSCRAEESALRQTLDLLDEWPAGEHRLDYTAFLSRLEERAGLAGSGARVIGWMPRWATAGLVAASIVCGVFAGLSGEREKPPRALSEQEVASAMDLRGFGDVVEGSITYSVDAKSGTVQQGGAQQ